MVPSLSGIDAEEDFSGDLNFSFPLPHSLLNPILYLVHSEEKGYRL